MGTRLIAGREMTWSDIEAGGRVAVISESFARELAAEPAAALGKRIRTPVGEDAWREVIGVVQSVHEDGLYEEPPSFVYWPVLMANMSAQPRRRNAGRRVRDPQRARGHRQSHGGGPAGSPVGERGASRSRRAHDAGSLRRLARTHVVHARDARDRRRHGVAARHHRDLRRHRLRRLAANSRNRHSVGARRRAAAAQEDVPAARARAERVGVVVGLVAAAALGRSMSSLLFGVEPLDPVAYVAALGAIIAAAALATYLPARRAAKIDPIETLRAE